MPKQSAVTQDEVDIIAIDLLVKGIMPSVNAVQAELKNRFGFSGGTQVVSRMLMTWRENAAKTLGVKKRPGIPEELSSIADRLLSSAMEHCTALLQTEANQIRLEAEEFKAQCENKVDLANTALAELRLALQAANDKNEVFSANLARLNSDLEAVISERDSLLLTKSQLVIQIAVAEESLRQEKARINEVTATMNARLSSQDESHRAEMARANEQYQGEISRITNKYQEDIAREREVRDGERKRIYKELDLAREENKSLIASHQLSSDKANRQIESIRSINAQLTKQIAIERERYSFAQGQIQAITEELASIRALAKKTEPHESQPEILSDEKISDQHPKQNNNLDDI